MEGGREGGREESHPMKKGISSDTDAQRPAPFPIAAADELASVQLVHYAVLTQL